MADSLNNLVRALADHSISGHIYKDAFVLAYNSDCKQLHLYTPWKRNHQIEFMYGTGCFIAFSLSFVAEADVSTSSEMLQILYTIDEDLSVKDPNDLKDILYLIGKIECECKSSETTMRGTSIKALFTLLLIRLVRALKTKTASLCSTRGKNTFLQFLQLVEKNFYTIRNVEFYAQSLSITQKQLSCICKQQTGFTPLTLIHQRTMIQLKSLLSETCMPIKEIADIFQFDDMSYFVRFFKREAGCTPKEYRKRYMRQAL